MELHQRKTLKLGIPFNNCCLKAVESKKCASVTFMIIYFITSLFKRASNKKLLKKNTRSLSYIVLDIDAKVSTEEDTQQTLSTPFSVDQQTLTAMVKKKDLEKLTQLGGVNNVAAALQTNETHGISTNLDEIVNRQKNFGSNVYLKPPNKGFLRFAVEALSKITVVELLVCAVLSIGFGIEIQGPKKGWYDGLDMIIATILVVSVSAINNFNQSRHMKELLTKNSDVQVKVVRDGIRKSVSIFDIVVGDIVFLTIGDQVPADGLFLDGHSVMVDESSIAIENVNDVQVNCENNPFLFSGTKVSDGSGRILVVSVGMNTTWGKLMSSTRQDLSEKTLLRAQIKKLTTYMGNIGAAVTLLVFIVLLFRYFTGHTATDANELGEFSVRKTAKAKEIINEILTIISSVVAMVAAAKSECLSLALTITLTYSMKRMVGEDVENRVMVRNWSAFETMGCVTIICTDKTGVLTSKEMSVAEFCLGKEVVREPCTVKIHVQELIRQAVALNTTGSVCRLNSELDPQISDSPTEKAILNWAMNDLGMDMGVVNQNLEVLDVEAFKSEKKRSGVMARAKTGNEVQVHWKGGAEIILAMCSNYYDRKGMLLCMDNEDNKKFNEIIQNMASKSLRCIAFAHKQAEGHNFIQFDESGLTLLAIVGLKNSCRPGVQEAVETCRNAKVGVKMITGDNLFTAKAIALECGIIKPEEQLHDKAVIEGTEFRTWSHEERMQSIDQIRVMARSSPSDKLLMVQCLKLKGHVVGVTGDGAGDVAALKEAHVGLSMGVQGTQVAKESSGLVILDDNFASTVTALRWSRCAYSNIRKIIQFQLTTTIVSHIISIVIAISSGSAPLLRPNNLIMDTLGSLALTTEPPTHDIMEKPPVTRTENLLITETMWINIGFQILYQVAVLLTLQFAGKTLFCVSDRVKDTIVFNCFVFCQVFNQFNARNPEHQNIFKGVFKNKCFLAIVGTAICLQVVVIEFMNRFEDTKRLTWRLWGACVALAVTTWLIDWMVKCGHVLISI